MQRIERPLVAMRWLALAVIIVVVPTAAARELNAFDGVILTLRIGIPLAVLIYALVLTVIAMRKHRECRRLLERISSGEPTWQPDWLKRHIETTFARLHMATRHRKPELDRDYLSERLHTQRSHRIEEMRRGGVINRMEGARIKSARIVEVLDYENDDEDRFTAMIRGSRIDCEKHARSAAVVGGKEEPTAFNELWTFRREGRRWVLDQIDDDVTISDLRETESFCQADVPARL